MIVHLTSPILTRLPLGNWRVTGHLRWNTTPLPTLDRTTVMFRLKGRVYRGPATWSHWEMSVTKAIWTFLGTGPLRSKKVNP